MFLSTKKWNNILAFISYEKSLGQQLEVTCEDNDILSLVNNAANQLDGTEYIPPIAEAIEEFVYHATNAIAAQRILSSDRLLSATKVYGKSKPRDYAEAKIMYKIKD